MKLNASRLGCDHTSDVCPSNIVTSQLGISRGKHGEVVEMSIGFGPI